MREQAAGSVPVVVAAMKHHVHEPALQQWACGVILNICAGSDVLSGRLRQLVADADALTPIVAAMRVHSELPQVRGIAAKGTMGRR